MISICMWIVVFPFPSPYTTLLILYLLIYTHILDDYNIFFGTLSPFRLAAPSIVSV